LLAFHVVAEWLIAEWAMHFCVETAEQFHTSYYEREDLIYVG